MGKHSFKEWIVAVRPWSFPASAMPVIVSLAFLYWKGFSINWFYGIWAVINIVLFHAAGNTWSDYSDYRKKVDDKDTFGATTITGGMFSAKEILVLSAVILAIAAAGGIALMFLTGLPLLWIGIGGVLCTVLYPVLKYKAAGDIVIFLAYSFLPAIGTSFVASGAIEWDVTWICIPVGLITVAILHINNLRDIRTDRRAGIRTLAMNLGTKKSVILYDFEILFPFLYVATCSITGIFPWTGFLVLPALAPAVMNVKTVTSGMKDGEARIASLDEATAKLQLVFSLLFAASFFIASLF